MSRITDSLHQDLCSKMVLSSDSGDIKDDKLLELTQENEQLRKELEESRRIQTMTDAKLDQQIKINLDQDKRLQDLCKENRMLKLQHFCEEHKKLQDLCEENKKFQDKITLLEQQLENFWSCSNDTTDGCDETRNVTEEETDPYHRHANHLKDLTSSGQPFDQESDDFCNDHWCTMDESERNDSFYYQRQPLPQMSEIQEINFKKEELMPIDVDVEEQQADDNVHDTVP